MKIIKIIPILAVVLLSLGSCIEEELVGNRVSEGEPTLMKLSLNASFRNDTPQSRANSPETNENKFSNVRVMVFSSSGKVVTNYKQDYQTPESKPTIDIKTFSGNDCSLYIIANTVKELDNALMRVESITQLNDIKITAGNLEFGLTDKPLLMTGIIKDVDIAPGKSTITSPIKMEYVSAKLTLKVIDATPKDHNVALLGWDVEDASLNTYLIPNGGTGLRKDANDDLIDDNKAWLTTSETLMPFEKDEKGVPYLTQYLFENRREGRVNNTPLPSDKYQNININDRDHRGKAFFAPKRATCIVIHAIHKTPTTSRALEARIFIGNDNHSNYDIERGNNYEFTVTVNGINNIDIDTNLNSTVGNFAVHATGLNNMDSHPDFRSIKIDAADGIATIEVLDGQGRSYNEPSFDATWVKVSPLDLMYHQVKQAGNNGLWQQDGTDDSFVRPKYIPHKSVRTALAGTGGWNTPVIKEDDDSMTLADATYRMCYEITDISFPQGAAIGKQLYVYTDDYDAKGGTRTAQIRVTFHPNGSPDQVLEEKFFPIIQNGYLGIFEDGGGLAVFNEDGTPSKKIRKFGVEKNEESGLTLYPNLSFDVQRRTTMQWGFKGTLLYNKPDKYRNGYFLTANAVYESITRKDNEPVNFGKTYRPKYGDGHDKTSTPLREPYTGTTSDVPYFQPPLSQPIYHPIYNSSAARYCHEKNRDLNGDGLIQDSETIWYLPSQHELMMIWISNIIIRNDYNTSFYMSATEIDSEKCWFLTFSHGATEIGKAEDGNINLKTHVTNIRCVRKL